MKKIGVVTITYNSEKVLEAFLQSTLSQTYSNFILYVIDNISQDSTLTILEKYKEERIKIIRNNKNVGVAKGNNQGIQLAINDACDYIMLLNNDVEFENTLFSNLVQHVELLNASMIAPKMMYHPEVNLIWWAGTFLEKKNGYLNYHRGIHEEDKGQYNNIETVDYAPTACVLMKKNVIDDIGLMDEKYFAYFDDTDFFYRIFKQNKHKLIYFPHAKFYHKVGGLSNMRNGSPTKFKFNDFYIHLNIRNHIYYLKKQKLLSSYILMIFLFFRFNARFFFSGKYHINFKTFKLINQSYFQGWAM
jgi:GT2 family glycosyltransferase